MQTASSGAEKPHARRYIGHPAAFSFSRTRRITTSGRLSSSALTRTTTQPEASNRAIRSMSHDLWRRSDQCCTPSYSYRHLPLTPAHVDSNPYHAVAVAELDLRLGYGKPRVDQRQ